MYHSGFDLTRDIRLYHSAINVGNVYWARQFVNLIWIQFYELFLVFNRFTEKLKQNEKKNTTCICLVKTGFKTMQWWTNENPNLFPKSRNRFTFLENLIWKSAFSSLSLTSKLSKSSWSQNQGPVSHRVRDQLVPELRTSWSQNQGLVCPAVKDQLVFGSGTS